MSNQNQMRKDLEAVRLVITRDAMKSMCQLMGLKNIEVSADYLTFAMANARLFDRKHSQYGARNIGVFGIQGIIIKCVDKYERIKNLFGQKKNRMRDEALEDSFRDLSVYGNIAMMVEHNAWPAN